MTIPRRIGLLAALAVTALGAGAPAASAGENEKISVAGGRVQFNHLGENLWAAADGVSQRYDGIRAYLDWEDARGDHTAYVTSIRTDEKASRKNLSIPEGTTVRLMACYIEIDPDDGTYHSVRCSLTQHAEA